MNLPLSPRLLTCAAFVAPGDRVADVGCDHGYLSIYLLKNGIASHVYASDLREGPLQSARSNAQKYGVAQRLRFYLSDGVQGIPRDFDALVCAGMGGDTMVHILESAPWLRSSQYSLILQCQSKTHLLRRYLSDRGWQIARETALKDGKFLYTVMEVLFAPSSPRLTPAQCYFSPALLQNPNEHTAAYLDWVIKTLRISTEHQADSDKEQALRKLQLYKEEL